MSDSSATWVRFLSEPCCWKQEKTQKNIHLKLDETIFGLIFFNTFVSENWRYGQPPEEFALDAFLVSKSEMWR